MQSTTGAVTIILIATHEEDISSSNNPSAHPNIVTKEKRNVMEHTQSSVVPQCTMLCSSFYFKILRFDEIWMGHSASQTAMHCRRSECVLFCFKIEEKKKSCCVVVDVHPAMDAALAVAVAAPALFGRLIFSLFVYKLMACVDGCERTICFDHFRGGGAWHSVKYLGRSLKIGSAPCREGV